MKGLSRQVDTWYIECHGHTVSSLRYFMNTYPRGLVLPLIIKLIPPRKAVNEYGPNVMRYQPTVGCRTEMLNGSLA